MVEPNPVPSCPDLFRASTSVVPQARRGWHGPRACPRNPHTLSAASRVNPTCRDEPGHDVEVVLRDLRHPPCAARAGARKVCCASWRTCSRSARIRTTSSSMPRLGAPHATGPPMTASSRRSRRMKTARRCIVQSGKPIGVIRTHAKAPVVLMANCNIVGQWAKPETFYELEKQKSHLLGRAHCRRLAIHRLAGRHSGHLRDFHADRGAAFRRRSCRSLRAHRGARRHGRRAAACRHHGQGRHPLRRSRSRAHRQAHRDRVSRHAKRHRSTRRSP